jgi:hypothetical protein
MRTTVELPDELLQKAKSHAALNGISLREFFIIAVRTKLEPEKKKVRKAPPSIGDERERPVERLTREEVDEALFG